MKSTLDIPWNRYALIAELTKKLTKAQHQFGKTALQKLVFLLQEVYKVDCGYDFELYSYGPFDSQLLSDLDLVEHWGCVEVQSVKTGFGGYKIRPTKKVDNVREKAANFLDSPNTKKSLDDLISTYGAFNAKDLELRATIIYVERDLRAKSESTNNKIIADLVKKIKPKFDLQTIMQTLDELNKKKHIQLTE